MNALEYARSQVNSALDLVNLTMQDLNDDQYNWQPAGTCNSIAKLHAHALTAADFFVNMVIGGGTPLWAEAAGSTGLPANSLEIWKSDARVPLAAMQAYSTKLRDTIDQTLGRMDDADLDKSYETHMLGKQTGAWVLQLAATHSAGHAGEISAIKGMQGLKGLPF